MIDITTELPGSIYVMIFGSRDEHVAPFLNPPVASIAC